MKISANKVAFLGIAGLLACTAATLAEAGPPAQGPAVSPRAPQFMLWFSRPIGGGAVGASLHPSFGLKLSQVRLMPSSGDPQATSEPMQHRELVNWQFGGRSGMNLSGMRVQFGRRLTWDVSRGSFGRPTQPSIPMREGALRASLGGPALGGAAPHPEATAGVAAGAHVNEPDRMERMELSLAASREARAGAPGRAEHNMTSLTMAALGPAQSIFLSHKAIPLPHEMRNVWPQH